MEILRRHFGQDIASFSLTQTHDALAQTMHALLQENLRETRMHLSNYAINKPKKAIVDHDDIIELRDEKL